MKLRKLIALLPAVLALGVVTACDNGGTKLHDYVHDGSVKLTLDYHNKDFYQDGICQVKLNTAIDGDTAHFTPLTGSNKTKLKARFYGVDTPESTGSVEPWGCMASKFTKEKLKEANEHGTIVVSTPAQGYEAPHPDSTGSRYVSMIWISLDKQNAPLEDLVSVNLWLVQEGLSWAKGLDDMPQYKETFNEAEAQARANKLAIFSGKASPCDPDIQTGYKDINLYDLAKELQEGLDDPDHAYSFNNTYVHFTGTVGGFVDGTLYLQRYFGEDESDLYSIPEGGEYVGINVFTGMGGIPSKFKQPNAYVEIYGLALYSENFGFQISDAYFPQFESEDDEAPCRVLLKADKNTDDPTTIINPETGERGHKLKVFEASKAELNAKLQAKDYSMLFQPVTVTDELTIVESYQGTTNRVSTYVSDDGDVSIAFDGAEFGAYVKGMKYQPDPDNDSTRIWTKVEDFVGQTVTLQNCILANFKSASGKYIYQLYLCDSHGMTVVSE